MSVDQQRAELDVYREFFESMDSAFDRARDCEEIEEKLNVGLIRLKARLSRIREVAA